MEIDLDDSFSKFFDELIFIHQKIGKNKESLSHEKEIFSDLKVKVEYDGNKEKIFELNFFKIAKPPLLILECNNFQKFDAILIIFGKMYLCGFTNSASKYVLVRKIIHELSKNLKNFDEMNDQLDKLTNMENIASLADNNTISLYKMFLSNHQGNVKMLAKIWHHQGSKMLAFNETLEKRPKLCMSEFITMTIKKMH